MSDYDERYRSGNTPWEIGKPQPALTALLEHGVRGPKVLDLGCGTGDLACTLARRGYHVTGIDISPTAIERARQKAAGLTATFHVQDATKLDLPNKPFDTIFDSGLLHNLHRNGGPVDQYLAQLPELAEPGTLLYILAISATAGQGWTITREYLQENLPEPTWTDTRIKDVTVTAQVDDTTITMPAYLLRTARSY
ncbi:ubiquinone/menaquinone biosynthesis methyltransferase ubiE [Actinoplanes sp. SE50]|uniref:class I SAM-dependent methyltransferase n=1 Tax=unclassified Actinoplanes TaxID=2626549 RepID=UPI00023EC115|nr:MULTISPECIES: class I SAM-dependent methyltransferase [unclassified Actinoplanes]AEV85204.1 Ubiquinone/menaquinone biosynthesis methyltransferase ubiE [Actinoplanes sp. SE50/110]ATO83599.1 ubiquinone/menaquinone biosynthesis methyltransferase ubiE [Actinoplanes sp. SE50]SLM01006.1 ubiquinone/menaquinone biosynthesis methyltransferase ubiE [Actinoplanes sp. SE50/110]